MEQWAGNACGGSLSARMRRRFGYAQLARVWAAGLERGASLAGERLVCPGPYPSARAPRFGFRMSPVTMVLMRSYRT